MSNVNFRGLISRVPATKKRKGEEAITDIDQTIIRRPRNIHPWSKQPESYTSGSVWVHMNAFRILNQFGKGRGRVIRPNTPEVQYAFLSPLNIPETHSHHWSPYDSIASRLAQKVRSIATVTAEIGALSTAFTNNANSEDSATKQINKSVKQDGRYNMQTVNELARKAYNAAPGVNIPKIKVDTPLYYENSDRRGLVLEFLLVAERDPFSDIIEPVQNIMRKAAPEFTNNLNIDFPYMWEVYTQPERFINYTTCVLEGVQPTWNSPFINGYPSSVNLQLSFRDLGPLYRQSIEKGTSINVINKNIQDQREEQGQNTQLEVLTRAVPHRRDNLR